MNIQNLNESYAHYIEKIKMPTLIKSPSVIDILEQITFTNYIKGLADYKMYTLEFHFGESIYHIYKMASSYYSRQAPICNGGLESKSFLELWSISAEEESLLFNLIDDFIVSHYKQLKDSISYSEIDKKMSKEMDNNFGFLTKHTMFKEMAYDGMDGGRYYRFQTGTICIGKHPLSDVWVSTNNSCSDEWFIEVLEEAKLSRIKQRETYLKRIKLLSDEINANRKLILVSR